MQTSSEEVGTAPVDQLFALNQLLPGAFAFHVTAPASEQLPAAVACGGSDATNVVAARTAISPNERMIRTAKEGLVRNLAKTGRLRGCIVLPTGTPFD
jgi:hypothetical protein